MDQATICSFTMVSIAIIAVPGPSVVFAVGRAIVGGRRPALFTVLGNAGGLFAQAFIVAVGLATIVGRHQVANTALTLAGCGCLVWLGIGAVRRRDQAPAALETIPRPPVAPLRDGFLVGASNPKSLVILATLLPRYVEPAVGSAAAQMLVLGGWFCLLAIVFDSAWVLAAAHARGWFSVAPRRLRWASVGSGVVMIGLGVLLLGGVV